MREVTDFTNKDKTTGNNSQHDQTRDSYQVVRARQEPLVFYKVLQHKRTITFSKPCFKPEQSFPMESHNLQAQQHNIIAISLLLYQFFFTCVCSLNPVTGKEAAQQRSFFYQLSNFRHFHKTKQDTSQVATPSLVSSDQVQSPQLSPALHPSKLRNFYFKR